jgi:hypothetical protein
MTRSTPLCVAVALLGAAALACTPARKQGAAPERASEAQPYDFEKEGKIPPPSAAPAPEAADVEEEVVEETPLEVEEFEAPVDTTLDAPPPKTIDGFRVQVFVSVTEQVAEGARRAAEERLGVPAYVEWLEGMYKVRVGDCATREEATVLLRRCRETYYSDAYIVEAQVRADRVAGVPQQGG